MSDARCWFVDARCRAIAMLLLVTGCGGGPPLAHVSGQVTLDGQPLPLAELVFQPDDGVGSPSFGVTDPSGRYELGYKRDIKGARIGSHTVRIRLLDEPSGSDGELIRRRPPLPARYNQNSELRREVQRRRNNVFDFELTSAAE